MGRRLDRFRVLRRSFSSYNKTYGSLAGVVVGLVFLWLTNVALLLGAEIDSELERGRQLQAGIAAESELQLPPATLVTSRRRRRRRPRTRPADGGSATRRPPPQGLSASTTELDGRKHP